jgi:hypothetical protein
MHARTRGSGVRKGKRVSLSCVPTSRLQYVVVLDRRATV